MVSVVLVEVLLPALLFAPLVGTSCSLDFAGGLALVDGATAAVAALNIELLLSVGSLEDNAHDQFLL